MISEEEINNAAIAYKKCVSKDNIRSEAAGYDFAQGAKWASRYSNFNWVDVKEDLPCNHNELICSEDKNRTLLVIALVNDYVCLSRMEKYMMIGVGKLMFLHIGSQYLNYQNNRR